MLLILELIAYLIWRLTTSWRPARSHLMKPCLVQTLFSSVHESRSLEKASLWRRSKKMPIGVIPAVSTNFPSEACLDHFGSRSWSLYFHYLGTIKAASLAYAGCTWGSTSYYWGRGDFGKGDTITQSSSSTTSDNDRRHWPASHAV